MAEALEPPPDGMESIQELESELSELLSSIRRERTLSASTSAELRHGYAPLQYAAAVPGYPVHRSPTERRALRRILVESSGRDATATVPTPCSGAQDKLHVLSALEKELARLASAHGVDISSVSQAVSGTVAPEVEDIEKRRSVQNDQRSLRRTEAMLEWASAQTSSVEADIANLHTALVSELSEVDLEQLPMNVEDLLCEGSKLWEQAEEAQGVLSEQRDEILELGLDLEMQHHEHIAQVTEFMAAIVDARDWGEVAVEHRSASSRGHPHGHRGHQPSAHHGHHSPAHRRTVHNPPFWYFGVPEAQALMDSVRALESRLTAAKDSSRATENEEVSSYRSLEKSLEERVARERRVATEQLGLQHAHCLEESSSLIWLRSGESQRANLLEMHSERNSTPLLESSVAEHRAELVPLRQEEEVVRERRLEEEERERIQAAAKAKFAAGQKGTGRPQFGGAKNPPPVVPKVGGIGQARDGPPGGPKAKAFGKEPPVRETQRIVEKEQPEPSQGETSQKVAEQGARAAKAKGGAMRNPAKASTGTHRSSRSPAPKEK